MRITFGRPSRSEWPDPPPWYESDSLTERLYEEAPTVPRIPKPYPHKGWFRTNAGGKRQHPLCRIEEGKAHAEKVLRVYLGQLGLSQQAGKVTTPPGSGIRATPVAG